MSPVYFYCSLICDCMFSMSAVSSFCLVRDRRRPTLSRRWCCWRRDGVMISDGLDVRRFHGLHQLLHHDVEGFRLLDLQFLLFLLPLLACSLFLRRPFLVVGRRIDGLNLLLALNFAGDQCSRLEGLLLPDGLLDFSVVDEGLDASHVRVAIDEDLLLLCVPVGLQLSLLPFVQILLRDQDSARTPPLLLVRLLRDADVDVDDRSSPVVMMMVVVSVSVSPSDGRQAAQCFSRTASAFYSHRLRNSREVGRGSESGEIRAIGSIGSSGTSFRSVDGHDALQDLLQSLHLLRPLQHRVQRRLT